MKTKHDEIVHNIIFNIGNIIVNKNDKFLEFQDDEFFSLSIIYPNVIVDVIYDNTLKELKIFTSVLDNNKIRAYFCLKGHIDNFISILDDFIIIFDIMNNLSLFDYYQNTNKGIEYDFDIVINHNNYMKKTIKLKNSSSLTYYIDDKNKLKITNQLKLLNKKIENVIWDSYEKIYNFSRYC